MLESLIFLMSYPIVLMLFPEMRLGQGVFEWSSSMICMGRDGAISVKVSSNGEVGPLINRKDDRMPF